MGLIFQISRQKIPKAFRFSLIPSDRNVSFCPHTFQDKLTNLFLDWHQPIIFPKTSVKEAACDKFFSIQNSN